MRAKVLARDGYACRLCGRKDLPLVLDHLQTHHLGGAHRVENLQALCGPCNSLKGNLYDNQPEIWRIRRARAAEFPDGSARDAYIEGFVDGFVAAWKGKSSPEAIAHMVRWAFDVEAT